VRILALSEAECVSRKNNIKPIKRERLSNKSSQEVEGEESHKVLSAIRTQTEEDILAVEGDN